MVAARVCFSTDVEILPDEALMSLMICDTLWITSTALRVSSWTPSILRAMSSAALALWLASSLISWATTAKPLPASPAEVASIVALSASRLVCRAIILIVSVTLLISAPERFRSWMVSEAESAIRLASPAMFEPSWTSFSTSANELEISPTAPETTLTLVEVCSAAEEMVPTLMLISSLAELMDATLTLISSAAEAIVLMFDVSCSEALATLDAFIDACSLCDSSWFDTPERSLAEPAIPSETFWISVTMRLKASARVLVASESWPTSSCCSSGMRCRRSPSAIAWARLRTSGTGRVTDRVTRMATSPPSARPASVTPRIHAEPGRVRGRAAVAAGRGLRGEELVEVGDPRHALVPRGLRLDERDRGGAVVGVDLARA